MEKIVVAAVEAARNTDRMISSLQWLSHDPDSQAGDLLSQTNSVVRRLLLQGGQVEALVGEEAGVYIAAPGPAQAGSEPEYL